MSNLKRTSARPSSNPRYWAAGVDVAAGPDRRKAWSCLEVLEARQLRDLAKLGPYAEAVGAHNRSLAHTVVLRKAALRRLGEVECHSQGKPAVGEAEAEVLMLDRNTPMPRLSMYPGVR